jgi:hypothetical protein
MESCTFFIKPVKVNKNKIVVKIICTAVFLHDISVDCVCPFIAKFYAMTFTNFKQI